MVLKKARYSFTLFILLVLANTCSWAVPEVTKKTWWHDTLLENLKKRQKQPMTQEEKAAALLEALGLQDETTTHNTVVTEISAETETTEASAPQKNQKTNTHTSQTSRDIFSHPAKSVEVGLVFLGAGRVVCAVSIEELPVSDDVKAKIKIAQNVVADSCDAGAEILISNGAVGAATSLGGKTYAANHALLVLLSKKIETSVAGTPLETVGKYIPGPVLRTAGAASLTALEFFVLQKIGGTSPAA